MSELEVLLEVSTPLLDNLTPTSANNKESFRDKGTTPDRPDSISSAVFLCTPLYLTPPRQRAIEHSQFSSREFLPQTMESLHKACSNLNKRGVMLCIQTQSIESNWIQRSAALRSEWICLCT